MSNEFRVTRIASIGGLPFSMSETSEDGDNRIADHAYPKRNDHYLEPMGLEADIFNVSGHIDVDENADNVRKLRNIFKQEKEISFYHPFYDEMYRVRIDNWRISSNQSIGRMSVSFRAYKVLDTWEISPVTESSAAAGLAAIEFSLTSDLDNYYQNLAYIPTIANDACEVSQFIDAAQSLNFEADRAAYRSALSALGVC